VDERKDVVLTEMAPNPRSNRCKSAENLRTGAWCYYTMIKQMGTYGKLYNWYAVMYAVKEDNATADK
jgi:hypothetical protein